jgi:Fe-S-cluster-containing hydrogenase component 2
MICSFSHENAFGSSISRITVVKKDVFGLDLPIVCWHCNPCNAMENCPMEALVRNEEGLIIVDEEKCVGCRKCMETCTIGAIRLHPKKNLPLVCDQCGGKPLCVERCPTKALTYVATKKRQPKSSSQILEETLERWGIVA